MKRFFSWVGFASFFLMGWMLGRAHTRQTVRIMVADTVLRVMRDTVVLNRVKVRTLRETVRVENTSCIVRLLYRPPLVRFLIQDSLAARWQEAEVGKSGFYIQDTLVGSVVEEKGPRVWYGALGVDNLRGAYVLLGTRRKWLHAFVGITHTRRVFSGMEVRF